MTHRGPFQPLTFCDSVIYSPSKEHFHCCFFMQGEQSLQTILKLNYILKKQYGKKHRTGGGIINYQLRHRLCDSKMLMYRQCEVLK